MRYLKNILAALLVIVSSIGVCGCMTETKQPEYEQMKQLALDYLNEHYDDEFAPVSYTGENWSYDRVQVVFTSKRFDDAIVRVNMYSDADAWTFQDNYFALTMESDAEQFFRNLMNQPTDRIEVKVRQLREQLPDGVDHEDGFEGYVRSGLCNIEVYYITSEEVNVQQQTELVQAVADQKIMGFIRFAVTDSDTLLEEYALDELGNTQDTQLDTCTTYLIDSKYQVTGVSGTK